MWLLFITVCAFGFVNPRMSYSRTKYSDFFTAANSKGFENHAVVQENKASFTIPTFNNSRAQGKSLFSMSSSSMLKQNRFLREWNNNSQCRF